MNTGKGRGSDRSRASDFLVSRILHRDGLILVIDKPAGLAVHAGPSGGESLEDYFDALRFGLPRPPALAHRLDRDTTGCLVLGRHPKALRKLGRLFQEGRVEKTYLAICEGTPAAPSGTIDAPLAKNSSGKGWRMDIAQEGQASVTTYRTLATNGALTLIEARPKTGRTHQIRVHLASIGAPIVGDALYGEKTGLSAHAIAQPICLHAARIVLPLTKNKDPLTIIAPLPPHFAEVSKTLDERARQALGQGKDAGTTGADAKSP